MKEKKDNKPIMWMCRERKAGRAGDREREREHNVKQMSGERVREREFEAEMVGK